MSCTELEERIALLAGGELDEAERQAVERHVEACARCRALATELSEVRGLLGEMAQEAPPEETLARVRSGVRRHITSPRRWPWAVAAAAAIVLAAGGAGLLDRRYPVPPPPPLVASAPEAPAVQRMPPAPARVRAPEPPPQVAAAPVEEPAEPLVVKLLTDDPDVVIYWIL